MKILNLLLLSGICGFLVACGDAGVVTNQGGEQYTPCSITLQSAAVTSTSNTPDPLLAYQWYLDKAYVKEAWVHIPGILSCFTRIREESSSNRSGR